ncbi:endoglycoceramidase [Polychytrium aggregatum]|uniref:endoglycoceramidase n=1 Tax=Polychytrium aggregatum TaxID=110093 RepID=UPI0022FF3A9A|nr:endoglycoceramidase [Polychytrium aggregatum]KAI9206223.1 endoglycoceramidase [Polychytrium aggregatum]
MTSKLLFVRLIAFCLSVLPALVIALPAPGLLPQQILSDIRQPQHPFDWIPTGNHPPAIVPISHISQRSFIDSYGRQRLFRGVNVVVKGPPWHPTIDRWDPQLSFSQEDVDFIADLNLNIVRLGVMWPGFEPSRGHYNSTYIAILKTIVERCRAKGIYVLLNMHQDVLSEKLCGEGIPLWAAEELLVPAKQSQAFPFPLEDPWALNNTQGIPSRERCDTRDWFEYHFAVATSRAYQRLYDDRNGIGRAMALFWARVAQEFGQYDNVLGYELINEPWAGDVFKNPLLLSPGVADLVNLQPFYEMIHAEIRKVDKERFVFFESVTWDNVAVGFTRSPGGSHYRNRSVLSYHHYDKRPNVLKIEKTFKERILDAARLKIGLMLTEFDIAYRASESVGWIKETLASADQHLQSWIGWEYKRFLPITGFGDSFFDPDTGELWQKMVPLFSRPYAQAVAGKITFMNFSQETSRYELRFVANEATQLQTTEIRFLKRTHYPNGFRVRIWPSVLSWEHPAERDDGLLILKPSSRVRNGEEITVVITGDVPQT